MTINRVTQNMMSQRSLSGLQTGLSELARIQEQLSTGRVLNRPSDSPSDTTSAMRMRSSISAQQQYSRNAQDGIAWLGQVDSALTNVSDQMRRARELALQGRNAATGQQGREALATELDQIRESLVSAGNTSYLGRPVFGGVTAGGAAYDSTAAYIGSPATPVLRTVGDGVSVDIGLTGPEVFGPDGTSIFDQLTAMSAALRANDMTAVDTGLGDLAVSMDRITAKLADIGTRTNRIEAALQRAADTELTLTNSLAEIENTDLPKAMVDLQMQEVAYQAALAATSRVLQPSLVDFLR